jgi:hypothetical protein
MPSAISDTGFALYKKFSNGGSIEIITGYKKRTDHKDIITIARAFAKMGKNVKITTDIHYKDTKYTYIFGALIGTKYERKCPDFIIDGVFYEYESFLLPFKKRKLANMISHGSKQSSRIIINNSRGASDRYIIRNIRERLADKNFKLKINEIWLYEKGKIRQLYKCKNRKPKPPVCTV